MKLISWNVNGIRAAAKKGFFEFLDKENPDILFLQETKAQEDQLDEVFTKHAVYKTYWHSAERKGYSSVALFTKEEPISVQKGMGVEKFDIEGRVIRAEYPKFVVYGIYFPNGGRAERLPYKYEFYDMILEKFIADKKAGKNVFICGDFNVAHQEVDLARPKENVKTSGFLPEERAWFTKLLASGFVDTFRKLNPDVIEKYSYWDQRFRARERNTGWRIDYFVASEEAMAMVKRAWIMDDVLGSDHCPVGIEVE